MKQYFVRILTTIGALTVASSAFGATLGLTTDTPTIQASFAQIEYLDDAPDGDLSTFDAEVDFTDGVSLTGSAFIDFGIGYSQADPGDVPGGGFSVFDDDGFNEALAGDIVDIGFTEDVIELLFDVVAGSEQSLFGSQVLMLINFDDPLDVLGANPFDGFLDGEIYAASLSVSRVVAPIPLPAGLPLMIGALAAFGLLRRRAQ